MRGQAELDYASSYLVVRNIWPPEQLRQMDRKRKECLEATARVKLNLAASV